MLHSTLTYLLPLTRARLTHHHSAARCYDNCEEWSPGHPELIPWSSSSQDLNKRLSPDLASSREMSISLFVNPSILCLNPARKLCYYGGKLRKIFGCIEFKLELTRAITDKKNARNVGECITETHPSQVTASLTRHQVPLVCVKLRSGWPILRGEQG